MTGHSYYYKGGKRYKCDLIYPYFYIFSDTPPDKRQPPTDEMIKKLEDYIPTRTYHFTLLRPSVLIQANDLPEYDVKKTRIISHRKAKKVEICFFFKYFTHYL